MYFLGDRSQHEASIHATTGYQEVIPEAVVIALAPGINISSFCSFKQIQIIQAFFRGGRKGNPYFKTLWVVLLPQGLQDDRCSLPPGLHSGNVFQKFLLTEQRVSPSQYWPWAFGHCMAEEKLELLPTLWSETHGLRARLARSTMVKRTLSSLDPSTLSPAHILIALS